MNLFKELVIGLLNSEHKICESDEIQNRKDNRVGIGIVNS